MTTTQGHEDTAERRGVLANRDFVKLWSGQTVSLVGSQVTDIALPLAAVITLNASAFQIGLLNVARFAPYVLVTLLAGVWFDRRRRKPTLIAADAVRVLLIGALPLAHLLGVLSLPWLYVVGFMAGVATVLFDVGILSYIPGLVDKDDLADANSKMTASYSVAGIAGPGLAGFLVGALTAPVALTVGATTYLASAVALWWIRRPEAEPERPAEQKSVRADIVEGLRTVVGSRILRHLATQSAVFNLFENLMTTVFLVYAVRTLGLTPFQLGLVVGAGSVGALLGATFSGRISKRMGFGPALRMVTLLACLSPLVLLVPGDTGPVSLTILGTTLAVHGFHLAVFNVNSLTLRQTVTPARLLGRMNASYRLILYGTIPLGALLAGSLASLFGLRAALAVGVAGIALPAVWILFSPVYRLREMPRGPVEAEQPETVA
ncbi:MFS transporter [Streptomyces erythrochromogenes]|uniref:MFS transporter n=1 Tax=Streptomyces erythrochromogenes TaxID=285574 RepID=UPI0033186A79